jgi:hypothetical protein
MISGYYRQARTTARWFWTNPNTTVEFTVGIRGI